MMKNTKKHRRRKINKPIEQFSRVFIIFLMFTLTLFSINLVSAFTFDNVKNYDENLREVTVVNVLGLGNDVAKIKLTSPLNVQVHRGYNKVAVFELIPYLDDNGGLDKMDFYNIRSSMSKFERDFDYKIKEIEQVSVNDYKLECSDVWNEINKTNDNVCTNKLIGSHLEDRVVWNDFNEKDLIKGETYTIGIFTNVQKGDYVEWIPTFYGVEIEEWSTWTESLNVGLVSYYNLSSDTTDSLGLNDGINNGVTFVPAQIGNGGLFNDTESDFIDVGDSSSLNFGTGGFSICWWMDWETLGSNDGIFEKRSAAGFYIRGLASNVINLFIFDAGEAHSINIVTSAIDLGAFHHYCLVFNTTSDTGSFYFDGTLNATDTDAGMGSTDNSENLTIGLFAGNYLDAIMDDIGIWNRTLTASEVSEINSSTTGFISAFPPIITILFPEAITYNETLTELNYSVTNGVRCWFSTDGGATNSSDVAAGTNFTGLTSTENENNWTVYCNSSGGDVGLDTVSFIVNQSVTTDLISPADATNFTTTQINFLVNSTPINTNLTNVTLSIWHDNGTILLTNFTTLSGNEEVQTNFSETLPQGNFIWNAETCGIDVSCDFDVNRTLTVHTTPPSVQIHFPTGVIDSFVIGNNLTLNWTITESGQNLTEHIKNCSLIYNGVTTTFNTSVCIETNESSFLYVEGVNNLNFSVLEEFGLTTTNTSAWSFGVLQINSTFNSTTLETRSENFEITINAQGATPTNAILNYGGTNFSGGTITNTGGNIYELAKTIQIPTSVGVKDWYFTVDLNSTNQQSPTLNQTVGALDFGQCNGTLTTPFINFTFKNESLSEEIINATIVSSWRYSLGAFTTSKTLSFSNATENPNYLFCSSASNDTLNIDLNMSYNNGASQQRAFALTSVLSNVTTTQVLYLLETGDGLFTQFRTEDNIGNTIIGAKAVITRTLNAKTITSASSFTDGSGIVLFFLDPDETYTATFSATGFLDNSFAFVPITDLRIVIMGGAEEVGEGSNISLSTTYDITPINSTLPNNTIITFGFNVTSTQDLTFIGFDIKNTTGTALLIVNDSSAGFISGSVNTGNGTKLIGTFVYKTANETITIKRAWFIGQEFVGDYSIFNQGTLFLEYDFDDFFQLLIVLISIIGLLIFMSAEGQLEDETKIAAVVLVVWFWSILGWIDTGIIVTSPSENITALTRLSSQYGIAILSTGIATYFILRRTFRQI